MSKHEYALIAVHGAYEKHHTQTFDVVPFEPDEDLLWDCTVEARKILDDPRAVVHSVGPIEARRPGQTWGKEAWRRIMDRALAQHLTRS